MSLKDWITDIFSAPSASQLNPPPVWTVTTFDPVSTYDVEGEFQKLMADREGRRNDVYKDSLGKLTVGIGHLVIDHDHLRFGQYISDSMVDMFWKADSASSLAAARHLADEAGITDPKFIPYLASVCFQLGNNWTVKFPSTWQMIVRGEYERAAVAVGGSLWARQTPRRTADFQAALRRLPAKP